MFWNRYFKSWPDEKVIFKIWCVVKFQFQNLIRFFPWIQNLTRCIFLYSKSDMSEYYISECNALFFTSISNTLYCIFLKSDAMSFSSVQKLTCGKILNQNHFFSKNHESCWVCCFHGEKKTNVIYFCELFWNKTYRNFLISKYDALFFFNWKSDTF